MIKIFATALLATATTAAMAAPLSPTEIVHRHEAAAAHADVNAMIADYADDAVVLEAGRTIAGKPAIRALFERMFPRTAAGAPAPGAAKINVTRIWQDGEVGLVSWTMGAIHGVDSFLVKDGKIKVQAVFLNEAEPKAPGAR